MVNVKFTVGCTRTSYFTKNQTAKVNAGIAIFEKVINSPTFKERINNFSWTTPSGTTYNRFLLCNGMSNAQVWDCLQKGCDWGSMPKSSTTTVNIVPCGSTTEMTWVANSPTPMVCINTNVINNTWYTPVHIACSLVHEYCVNLGFSCHVNGRLVEDWHCCVPSACADICCEIAREMSMSNTDISNYFRWIDTANFDYFACTTCYHVEGYETNNLLANTRFDEIINSMCTEIECLERTTKRNSKETTRLTTVTDVVNTLRELKTRLYSTSLDGCERVTSPILETEAATALQ